MAISFKRYINIVSGVGAGATVRLRDLILRVFSDNTLVPAGEVIEMDNAADVATYFGTSSEEYARAVVYFGFVSKVITAPKKISFSRWASAAAVARIYGSTKTFAVAQFTGISNGALALTLGSYTATVTGVDFTAATTLSNIASTLQTAIRAVTAGGTPWTGATVTYNATKQRFELVAGGTAGLMPVSVGTAGSGTDLATYLGWDSTGVFSPGVAAEEPLDAFITSAEASDNFGSFVFVGTLTLDQVVAVAQQNDTYNVKFIQLVPVSQSNAPTYYAALSGISGVSMTLSPLAGEYPELLPAMVLAATDYTRRASTQNYMFQQADFTPSVTTNAVANAMDAVRANYYGRTQTAGQFLDFYQRGVMMGLPVDPVDLNTYANEMWLKDAVGAALMQLLLALSKVSANSAGRSQILATIQPIIEQAIFNGTISVGKPLSSSQKLYIGTVTGDEKAWRQVFSLGYWLDCVIQSYTTVDSRTEYKAVYTLVYAKDDTIRAVDGSHILI